MAAKHRDGSAKKSRAEWGEILKGLDRMQDRMDTAPSVPPLLTLSVRSPAEL